MHSLLGFLPGGSEWIVIALFGLLLFGKRLPEVARSLGQSVTEFKKGLGGIEDEIQRAISESNPQKPEPPAETASSAPELMSPRHHAEAHDQESKPATAVPESGG